MKETFVRTARQNGDSLAINIPKEIVELLNLKEGNILRVEIEKIER